MAVSPPPAPSSIDLSGLPPRVVEAAARVLALCREELRSEPRPEAPEEVELRVREATNEFARDVMGAVIENRDDGASRIERDGHSWFRVAVTPKTIMTSLRPVTYRRARYRGGASGASPVPVDESLGLVDDYLTRPAAELGLLIVVRHRRLTPRNRSESRPYHAVRRLIRALNNTVTILPANVQADPALSGLPLNTIASCPARGCSRALANRRDFTIRL